MSVRKRKAIDIKTKLEIIKAVKDGQKKTDVANKFGIAKSTLATILSQCEMIENNLFPENRNPCTRCIFF